MNEIAQQKLQPLGADEARALVARVADSRNRVLTELRKVVVGQEASVDLVLAALFSGGHCLLTGVPGLAKTLLVRTLAQILDLGFRRIQFTPDLMPSDITGTEVLDETDGIRALRFVRGPGVHPAPARRRDQPHAAQDPGRPARGHAGGARHGGRPQLRARAAVLRARHAEPDRTRGHVPAARGPARSLPLQHRHDLPPGRRRGEGRDADDRRAPRDAEPCPVARGHPADSATGAARGRGRGRGALRGAAVGGDAADAARRARLRQEVRQVGRRTARLAGARPRRQGARADARSRLRDARGHPDAGGACVPSPRR